MPQHLAIAATFLVHPKTTTHAKAEEKECAHVALRLLRLITTLVTPKDAKFNLAFSFAQSSTSRSGRHRTAEDDPNSELRHYATRPLNLGMGRHDSLWSRAEDFWHAVGWAFNCSVLHPARWERWQLWLEFMCGVIDDDWAEREREYEANKEEHTEPIENGTGTTKKGRKPKGKGSNPNDDGLAIFRESIIFQYISTGFSSGNLRRIFRAIFADGSSTSVNEFRQVFSKELAVFDPNRKRENPKKRDRQVDIERDEFGDYLTEEETDDEANGTATGPRQSGPRQSKRTKPNTAGTAPETANAGQASTQQKGVSSMGGIGSLNLRKRLLGILLNVSLRLPNDFIDKSNLFDLFVENIRHLPLPVFQAFVSPYVLPHFSDAAQSTLCELLLFHMLESAAPETEEENLTKEKLEQCFLPYAAAAASVVNNAKVSILLEACVMLLVKSDMLSSSPEFITAVEDGILRRAERSQEEFRRSHNSREQEPIEWCWLVESGERLNYLVELLQPA